MKRPELEPCSKRSQARKRRRRFPRERFHGGLMGMRDASPRQIEVVSRIFRTFNLAERHPALGHAVMAPLICWSLSSSMLRYLFVDHAVPAMWRSLAAARLSAD